MKYYKIIGHKDELHEARGIYLATEDTGNLLTRIEVNDETGSIRVDHNTPDVVDLQVVIQQNKPLLVSTRRSERFYQDELEEIPQAAFNLLCEHFNII